MNNLLKDFIIFIKSLDFVDILFVVSLIALVVLITTLIYIIKVNDDEELEGSMFDEEEVKTTPEAIKNNEEELDLSQITKEIESAPVNPVTLNDYEREQEEKAIISYDELIKTKDLKEDINYIKEMQLGDLTVKSVDSKNVTTTFELPKVKDTYDDLNLYNNSNSEPMADVRLFSYQKEEEFLQTLKKLQKLLD